MTKEKHCVDVKVDYQHSKVGNFHLVEQVRLIGDIGKTSDSPTAISESLSRSKSSFVKGALRCRMDTDRGVGELEHIRLKKPRKERISFTRDV